MTAEQKMREEFEEWYSCNAFDYEKNPIGSRDCGLQWTAYQAGRASAIPAPDEQGHIPDYVKIANLRHNISIAHLRIKELEAELEAERDRGAPEFDEPDAYIYKTACPWGIAFTRAECTYGDVPAARIVPIYFVSKEWKGRQAEVPDGWKLVPIEPTPEMIDAAWEALPNHPSQDLRAAEYRAMLAAAPIAKEQTE